MRGFLPSSPDPPPSADANGDGVVTRGEFDELVAMLNEQEIICALSCWQTSSPRVGFEKAFWHIFGCPRGAASWTMAW